MTIDVRIRGNAARFIKNLERAGKQAEFANVLALTRTAFAARPVVQDEMRRRLDQPTSGTIRSVLAKPAKKSDPSSEVKLRDEAFKGTPAVKYLSPLVTGGERGRKRSELALQRVGIISSREYLVPGEGARLNRFGNVSAGQYTKMLSALRASSDPQQNRPFRRASRGKGKKESFFVLQGRGTRLIMRKRGRGKPKPMFAIVRTPRYQKIFPFDRIVDRFVRDEFPKQHNKALKDALRTAIKRAAR